MTTLAKCPAVAPDLLHRLRRAARKLRDGDTLAFAALILGTVAMAVAVLVWLDRAVAALN